MDLAALVARPPMRLGEARLPWDDAAFSSRMLAEHLDTTHDLASRRSPTIDAHVQWLETVAPGGSRVLDLGCGPGLYLERFASEGWACTGIDISPAAIDHAERRAHELGLACSYLLGDLRTVEVVDRFDLVLCLFGELSTFPLDEVARVLERVARWLGPDGRAVIELSTRAAVQAKGARPWSWHAAHGGLFAPGRHIVLRESQWFADELASVERWWVVDEEAPTPRRLGSTTWWHGSDLSGVVDAAGLVVDARVGDPAGAEPDEDDEFEVLVLRAR